MWPYITYIFSSCEWNCVISHSVLYFLIKPEAFKSYVCCYGHLSVFFSNAKVSPHPSLPLLHPQVFLISMYS